MIIHNLFIKNLSLVYKKIKNDKKNSLRYKKKK